MGLNWVLDGDLPHPSVYDIFQKGQSVYTTGESGAIFKKDLAVSILQTNSGIPDEFSLSQNYPNPFNPSTNIKFDISKLSNVKLRVYDILGNEIAVLVNKLLKPGSYTANFDGSGLASGIYYLRLEADGYSKVRKMNLLK